MADKAERSWLKLEIGAGAMIVLIAAVGLAAPPLWRKYQEIRRTVLLRVRADGTAWHAGRQLVLPEHPYFELPASPASPGSPGSLRALLADRNRRLGFDRDAARHEVSRVKLVLVADPQADCSAVQKILVDGIPEKLSALTINDWRVKLPLDARSFAVGPRPPDNTVRLALWLSDGELQLSVDGRSCRSVAEIGQCLAALPKAEVLVDLRPAPIPAGEAESAVLVRDLVEAIRACYYAGWDDLWLAEPPLYVTHPIFNSEAP